MALYVEFNNITMYDMVLHRPTYLVGGGQYPGTWDIDVEASDELTANGGLQKIEISENGLAMLGENETWIRAVWYAENQYYAGVWIRRKGGLSWFSGNHIQWYSSAGGGSFPNGRPNWTDRGDRVSPMTVQLTSAFYVEYNVEYGQALSKVEVNILQRGGG